MREDEHNVYTIRYWKQKVSKTNEGDYLITFIETKRQYSISKSGEISEEYTYVDNIESITDIFKGITDESVIE